MRFIVYLLLAFSMPVMSQTSVYDLTVRTAYGGDFELQHYKGQKILIAIISVENLSKKGKLEFWDSIKTANPKVSFILIPAADMDTIVNDSAAMVDIREQTTKEIVVAESRDVRKDKREKKQPIVNWLTDVKQNQYFDNDVVTDEQYYVISESGILFAVMEKGVRMSVLNEVLTAPDIKKSALGVLKR